MTGISMSETMRSTGSRAQHIQPVRAVGRFRHHVTAVPQLRRHDARDQRIIVDNEQLGYLRGWTALDHGDAFEIPWN